MKKYTRPSIEVVELTVRESLSALPTSFRAVKGFSTAPTTTKNGTAAYNNATVYKKISAVKNI